MKPTTIIHFEGVECQPIETFTEKAYLDYSMYVIMDRALPHIADGLKPVQRRIIYAMSELGLNALAKYKKSARTVGDVLGKFHPHGDTACYEAMVLLAQPFSYRYPLIDGQGNWGSPDDPKSFAAMRYTEARLSRFAALFLSELEQGTVPWGLNFDGTLEEPKILPARVPTLLLNGTTGIAVGMATDIPPHNLKEVILACILLLKNPKASLDEMMALLPGPDFPTSAEIISTSAELRKIYETGQGIVRVRAQINDEEGDIVITALPHQVSGSKVLEQIAQQMQAKKLPMVSDLRDESDHENPTRLVIEPRAKGIDKEALMLHLFATTDLERSVRVNMNVIGLNGRPQVKDLITFLKEWLTFRIETVRRRLVFQLEKVKARLHILEGLLIVFLNVDEVIALIRHEENPKIALMARFKLSAVQAEAILDLKLRHLAKLEEQKIKEEQATLSKEQRTLEETLNSENKLRTLVRKELEEDLKSFGDERRSPIVARAQAQILKESERVAIEPVTVILSAMGWIRAAKGHEAQGAELNYKAGDQYLMQWRGKSNDVVYFLDSTGRCYCLNVQGFPSARGLGEPLTSKLNPPSGATFVGMIMGGEKDKVIALSDKGYGLITTLSEWATKNRSGKTCLKVPEGSKALAPIAIGPETSRVALLTDKGHLLVVRVTDFPEMNKGKGNKMIQLASEMLIGAVALSDRERLSLQSARRTLLLKPDDLNEYEGPRGQRGHALPKGFGQITQWEKVN